MSVLQTLAANTLRQKKLTDEVAAFLAGLRGYLRTHPLYQSEATLIPACRESFPYVRFEFYPGKERPTDNERPAVKLLTLELRFTNEQVRSIADAASIADSLKLALGAKIDDELTAQVLVGKRPIAGIARIYISLDVGEVFQDAITEVAYFDCIIEVHTHLCCNDFLNIYNHAQN